MNDANIVRKFLSSLSPCGRFVTADSPSTADALAALDRLEAQQENYAGYGEIMEALEARAVAAEQERDEMIAAAKIIEIKGLSPESAQLYFDQRNEQADLRVVAEAERDGAREVLEGSHARGYREGVISTEADRDAAIARAEAAESRVAALEEALRKIELWPVDVSRNAAVELAQIKEFARTRLADAGKEKR